MLSPGTAEKITELVIRSNFADLTPETLLEAFKAEGIASLEDLADQLTQALRDPKGQPEGIPYSDLFSEPTSQALRDAIVHQVPTVPFVMDGVMHDPEDIGRYNGEELGFLPQQGGTELLVLRGKDVWGPLMRTALLSRAVTAATTHAGHFQHGGYSFLTPVDVTSISVGGSGPGPGPFGPPVAATGPEVSLWTDINWGGTDLTLNPGESYRDLTNVGWWIFSSSWNDRISSVWRTSSLCLAFEHVGFAGSFLWIGPNFETTTFDNLHPLGWGDRISSVINGG